jgi:ribosomal-protein-alanine N-acetyltransferase
MEKETEAGKQIKFGVFIKNDLNKIIGTVSFSNIIKGPFLSCFLGYRTDEKENGKGYTTEAIKRGIEYVFDEIKLHRIEANIIPANTASIKVVEKLGFKLEGYSRNYLQINRKWEDHLHYALLNEN